MFIFIFNRIEFYENHMRFPRGDFLSQVQMICNKCQSIDSHLFQIDIKFTSYGHTSRFTRI